jgi:S-formylglutathione hydrolase FrmB
MKYLKENLLHIYIPIIIAYCLLFSADINARAITNNPNSRSFSVNTERRSGQLYSLKVDSVESSIPNEYNLVINTANLPKPNNVVVILPENYRKAKYPLVFMLHGWSGDQNQWKTTADLHYYANKYGFIIVCPDGLYDSWYIDNRIDKKINYEKYFFDDLYNEIVKTYKVDTSNVFITGLSMGGFGAITYFTRHPGLFRAAASTSGILDITKFKGKWGMDKVFASEEDYNMYSPINNIYRLENINKKILIDCGEQDFAYKVNEAFYSKCKEMNIPAVFYSGEGNHSHSYWKKSVARHFDFFYKQIKRNNRHK